jgi:hypothetical protein
MELKRDSPPLFLPTPEPNNPVLLLEAGLTILFLSTDTGAAYNLELISLYLLSFEGNVSYFFKGYEIAFFKISFSPVTFFDGIFLVDFN